MIAAVFAANGVIVIMAVFLVVLSQQEALRKQLQQNCKLHATHAQVEEDDLARFMIIPNTLIQHAKINAMPRSLRHSPFFGFLILGNSPPTITSGSAVARKVPTINVSYIMVPN